LPRDGIEKQMLTGAPLPSVLLSRTGQDVRLCQACAQCDDLMADGMDLAFGEILRLAARNDEHALTCSSLWCCEPLLGKAGRCPAGIDVPAVIRALRQEALRRGYHPQPPTPDWIL
jgi:heterodisulfide reductase subunit C